MSIIPSPTSLDTARRWVRETRTETASGRRLTGATIGKGGIKVYRNGSIYIDGTLNIVNGNLKLAGGLIEGDALKTQTRPVMFSIPRVDLASLPVRGYNKWGLLSEKVLTPPSWAKRAIIYASCLFKIHCNYSGTKTSKQGGLRISTNTRVSPEIYAATDHDQETSFTYPTVETVTGEDLRVRFEYWLSDLVAKSGSSADCSGLILWTT